MRGISDEYPKGPPHPSEVSCPPELGSGGQNRLAQHECAGIGCGQTEAG